MGVIWCIPGFLGLQSDWDFLPWPHRALSMRHGQDDRRFREDTLIGYSMGGRLALRILEARHFGKAVIVSAGLNTPDRQRRLRDAEWAQRFETEKWSTLMEAWNAQPVFGGHTVERREEDYDRAELARQLRDWSPAILPPPRLERITTQILWVAGERDEKYVETGRRAVERLQDAELWVCPNAGHRVPWEQPEAFVARLREFLELQ